MDIPATAGYPKLAADLFNLRRISTVTTRKRTREPLKPTEGNLLTSEDEAPSYSTCSSYPLHFLKHAAASPSFQEPGLIWFPTRIPGTGITSSSQHIDERKFRRRSECGKDGERHLLPSSPKPWQEGTIGYPAFSA
jgi:hypothetical protein